MTEDLQMARHIRASAAYLRTHGWIQGTLGVDGGPRCMGGAISSATGTVALAAKGSPDSDFIIEISGVLGFDNMRVGEWNDEPGRTVEEVLDRLESTALALEVRALAAEPVKELVAV